MSTSNNGRIFKTLKLHHSFKKYIFGNNFKNETIGHTFQNYSCKINVCEIYQLVRYISKSFKFHHSFKNIYIFENSFRNEIIKHTFQNYSGRIFFFRNMSTSNRSHGLQI